MTTTTRRPKIQRRTTLPRRQAWKALQTHYKSVQAMHLRTLFTEDPQRGGRMTMDAVGVLLDYSKNRITDGFCEIGPVDIGNKPERHSAFAVILERFVGHHRPQVRAADADIHDGFDPLACMAFPLTAPHAVRKPGHLIQDCMYLGDDILTIDHHRGF